MYRITRQFVVQQSVVLSFAVNLFTTFEACSQELRTAETHPADYPTSIALQFMSDRLAQKTNNTLALKIYTGGQLGEEKDALELTILGGIDICRVSLAPLNSIAPGTTVLAMPFLFRSTAHMRTVLDGAIGAEILASLDTHGLIGLAYYDSGARSIYNTIRPIRTPADVEGLKIRVQNSDVAVAMVKAMGGNPTPMGFGQVYESLLLGAIDGSENNWASFDAAGHYEVATHYSLTRHTMVPEVLVASKERWQRLSREQQQAVRQAAVESVAVMRREWDARVERSRRRVLDAGVEVVEDIDIDEFEAAVQPVYDQFIRSPAERDLVERIRAVGGTQ